MQSPSSLIFLVLLGVWAAYFVQYWVRRRDHLATARSVEQFTAALRVLERRDPLPGADLSEPAPRSYAVHPARSVRPQVLVKRAEAAHPAAVGVTERVSGETDSPSSARRGTPAGRAAGRGAPPERTGRPVHGVARGPAPRPSARARVRPSRRLRGLLFLMTLLALAAVGTLVALLLVPLWALAPAGIAVVGAFLWVRSAVRAEAALVRAHRQSHRARRAGSAASASHTSARAVRVPVTEEGPVKASPDAFAEPTEPARARTAEAPTPAPLAEAPAVVAEDVMVPIMDEDDMPLTWDPVPVPRPTYTMKAKAERPEVEPAPVTPDPVPVERDSGADGTAYEQERRVAGA